MLQWPWRQFTSGSSDLEWFESVEDEERLERPSTSKAKENVERVSEMIRSNRWMIIREISEDLNISYGTIKNILTTDLNIRWVSAKFVPRVLMVKQKQQRLSISLELRDHATSDSSFSRNVIMGNETWVYGYDPETRVQSSQWKSPSSSCVKKACQAPTSRWWCLCFLTLMELCELSLYPGTLWWTLSIIRAY